MRLNQCIYLSSEKLLEIWARTKLPAPLSSEFGIPPVLTPWACRHQEELASELDLSINTLRTCAFKFWMQPQAHCGALRLAFSSVI